MKFNPITIGNIGGNPTSAANNINVNSTRIQSAFENTLSRDGSGPNQMEADLDMNDNDILNIKDLPGLKNITVDNLKVKQSADFNGVELTNVGAATVGDSAVNLQQLSDAIAEAASGGTGFLLRQRLLGDRTYYVSPTGSDLFPGTSSLLPFKTIQKAVDTAYSLDWNGYNVTIQLADGTYTAGVVASGRFVGLTTYNGGLTIKGNAATPSNVQVIPATSSYSFNADKGANLIIKDLYVANPNGGICLLATQSGTIYFGNLEFGQSAYTHCEATQWGFINAISNYKISGGAVGHLHCPQGGQIWVNNVNVTLVGTPNFTTFFVGVAGPGECHAMSFTFTGSATGPRFLVHSAGTIFMNAAANLNYFPGSIAGTIDDQTFGVYDYKPQTTFPTLTGNNSFTARMAVNGAQINGMLNVATGADNTMRWTDGAGGPEMTAVNQLQNGFKVMFMRASDFQWMVSANGTPTLRVLNGAVGINNSGMNSPLQVAVNSTDTMRWTTTTNGSEMSAVNQAQSAFRIMSLRGNEVRMYGDANTTPTVHVTASGLAFNNATPMAKPTITGSRGGNAALASLLTALASYGLIIDGTSA